MLGVDDCVNDALSLSLYLTASLTWSLPRLKNKVRQGVELTANAEELWGDEGGDGETGRWEEGGEWRKVGGEEGL